jgi:hypothetical protein
VERVPRPAEEQRVGVPEVARQAGAGARGDRVELDVERRRPLLWEEVVDEGVVPGRSAKVARADEEPAAGPGEPRLGGDRALEARASAAPSAAAAERRRTRSEAAVGAAASGTTAAVARCFGSARQSP